MVYKNFYIAGIEYYESYKIQNKLKIGDKLRFKTEPQNRFDENAVEIYYKKYKLKPNDALILATCKHYNIKYLISIDNDFAIPCEKEVIVLIDSVEKLKEVLNKENLS